MFQACLKIRKTIKKTMQCKNDREVYFIEL